MNTTATIYLVDDHRMMNEGLKHIIESRNNYKVTKVFSRASELLDALNFEQPDLIISDISMPGMTGLELAAEVLKKFSNVKILILSMHVDPEYVKPAMQMGVHGYLLKDSRVEDIFDAIDAVLEGNKYISPKASAALVSLLNRKVELTPRELDVLLQVAKGSSTKEIAENLFLSTHTVDTHRKNLLAKSDCANTAELIVWGMSEGYFEKRKSN